MASSLWDYWWADDADAPPALRLNPLASSAWCWSDGGSGGVDAAGPPDFAVDGPFAAPPAPSAAGLPSALRWRCPDAPVPSATALPLGREALLARSSALGGYAQPPDLVAAATFRANWRPDSSPESGEEEVILAAPSAVDPLRSVDLTVATWGGVLAAKRVWEDEDARAWHGEGGGWESRGGGGSRESLRTRGESPEREEAPRRELGFGRAAYRAFPSRSGYDAGGLASELGARRGEPRGPLSRPGVFRVRTAPFPTRQTPRQLAFAGAPGPRGCRVAVRTDYEVGMVSFSRKPGGGEGEALDPESDGYGDDSGDEPPDGGLPTRPARGAPVSRRAPACAPRAGSARAGAPGEYLAGPSATELARFRAPTRDLAWSARSRRRGAVILEDLSLHEIIIGEGGLSTVPAWKPDGRGGRDDVVTSAGPAGRRAPPRGAILARPSADPRAYLLALGSRLVVADLRAGRGGTEVPAAVGERRERGHVAGGERARTRGDGGGGDGDGDARGRPGGGATAGASSLATATATARSLRSEGSGGGAGAGAGAGSAARRAPLTALAGPLEADVGGRGIGGDGSGPASPSSAFAFATATADGVVRLLDLRAPGRPLAAWDMGRFAARSGWRVARAGHMRQRAAIQRLRFLPGGGILAIAETGAPAGTRGWVLDVCPTEESVPSDWLLDPAAAAAAAPPPSRTLGRVRDVGGEDRAPSPAFRRGIFPQRPPAAFSHPSAIPRDRDIPGAAWLPLSLGEHALRPAAPRPLFDCREVAGGDGGGAGGPALASRAFPPTDESFSAGGDRWLDPHPEQETLGVALLAAGPRRGPRGSALSRPPLLARLGGDGRLELHELVPAAGSGQGQGQDRGAYLGGEAGPVIGIPRGSGGGAGGRRAGGAPLAPADPGRGRRADPPEPPRSLDLPLVTRLARAALGSAEGARARASGGDAGRPPSPRAPAEAVDEARLLALLLRIETPTTLDELWAAYDRGAGLARARPLLDGVSGDPRGPHPSPSRIRDLLSVASSRRPGGAERSRDPRPRDPAAQLLAALAAAGVAPGPVRPPPPEGAGGAAGLDAGSGSDATTGAEAAGGPTAGTSETARKRRRGATLQERLRGRVPRPTPEQLLAVAAADAARAPLASAAGAATALGADAAAAPRAPAGFVAVALRLAGRSRAVRLLRHAAPRAPPGDARAETLVAPLHRFQVAPGFDEALLPELPGGAILASLAASWEEE